MQTNVRQPIKPGSHRGDFTLKEHWEDMPLDQAEDETAVRDLKRMLDGFVNGTVLPMPGRCTRVEVIPSIRFGLHQLVFEQFSEQDMIAIPGAVIIQGDQEQVASLQ